MTIPDDQTLMLPVLTASQQGEVRIGDVTSRLADQLHLTAQERTELLPLGLVRQLPLQAAVSNKP